MDKFTVHKGLVAPMDRENVDTDAIIPKQFLKSIKRSGFGPNLFDEWRYLDHGEPGQDPATRQSNPDFVLNQARYQDASVLLARKNFGCGSSREHAPWALEQYGFRALIAPSFADIFFNNCFKNGVLPIQLPESAVSQLFDEVFAFVGYQLTVDLQRQVVVKPDGTELSFRGAALPQILPAQRLRRHRPDACATPRRSRPTRPSAWRACPGWASACCEGRGGGRACSAGSKRVVLSRLWLTYLVLGLSFFAFGAGQPEPVLPAARQRRTCWPTTAGRPCRMAAGSSCSNCS